MCLSIMGYDVLIAVYAPGLAVIAYTNLAGRLLATPLPQSLVLGLHLFQDQFELTLIPLSLRCLIKFLLRSKKSMKKKKILTLIDDR